MISETLLRALQEGMRKLTEASSTFALRIVELRAAVERARLAETTEAAQEAVTARESERLPDELKALHEHINDLIRAQEDPALMSVLQEVLKDLESTQHEVHRQLERLRSRGHEALERATAELEFAEQEHRRIADQAMKLREHIEKVSHT
jgi:predicted  nucleic acid-binding Zn-ribbon protein